MAHTDMHTALLYHATAGRWASHSRARSAIRPRDDCPNRPACWTARTVLPGHPPESALEWIQKTGLADRPDSPGPGRPHVRVVGRWQGAARLDETAVRELAGTVPVRFCEEPPPARRRGIGPIRTGPMVRFEHGHSSRVQTGTGGAR
jgi:hypothetical protein